MSTLQQGRGGRRPGAGRPRKSEATTVIRVPLSQVPRIRSLLQRGAGPGGDVPGVRTDCEILTPAVSPPPLSCPLYQSRVAAGFPSPADDYVEGQLDLNRYLIDRPAATFFVRVQGDSMLGAGIHPGDLLIVDRSRQADDGRVIIAVLDGELTVKRLRRRKGQVWLHPDNEAYPPLLITEDRDFHIWGVVRHVVHSF